MTKYRRREGLEKHLLLAVLETGKSKIKALAGLVSDEDPPLGLLVAMFLLGPHMAEDRERKQAVL